MSREQDFQVVLTLLRASLGLVVRENELGALRSCKSKYLVRVSTAHGIANLVASSLKNELVRSALDPDLALFFQAMRDSNAERNKLLKEQIIQASATLGASGIGCVALKGGAELFSPLYTDIADRFLSDIDLLVPAEQIHDANRVLEDIGYTTRGANYITGAIHTPALWHDKWPTAIELHTSVCEPPGNSVIGANGVFERASTIAGHVAKVPALIDRVCHLIVHAQVHSNRYEGHWLLLRDVADLHWMDRCDPDWGEVRRRFKNAGLMPLLDGFVCAAVDVLGLPVGGWSQLSVGNEWAARTLDLLARPQVHRAALIKHYIRHYPKRFFFDRDLRRKYLKDLMDRKKVNEFIRRHWDGIRGFQ